MIYYCLVKKVLNHFKKADPKIYKQMVRIISIEGKDRLSIKADKDDLFINLCDSIISQQLSNKAAATIFERFKKLFPEGEITPQKLEKISPEKLRSAGISYQKINYLKDLSSKVNLKEIELGKFKNLEDENIIEQLTVVKGIGKWTAEMFLMFALGREDVFSYGDLILRKSFQKLYGFKSEPTLEEIEKITSKWSPYKTYASKTLWASFRLQ